MHSRQYNTQTQIGTFSLHAGTASSMATAMIMSLISVSPMSWHPPLRTCAVASWYPMVMGLRQSTLCEKKQNRSPPSTVQKTPSALEIHLCVRYVMGAPRAMGEVPTPGMDSWNMILSSLTYTLA